MNWQPQLSYQKHCFYVYSIKSLRFLNFGKGSAFPRKWKKEKQFFLNKENNSTFYTEFQTLMIIKRNYNKEAIHRIGKYDRKRLPLQYK